MKITKKDLGIVTKTVGKSMLFSTVRHLCRKETYMTAIPLGVGAALASKDVKVGLYTTYTAVAGIIGHGAYTIMPAVLDTIYDEEYKSEGSEEA